ncbi:MAG: hypothetical protein ACI9OJ_005257, partial [Myxococcota bacterium]
MIEVWLQDGQRAVTLLIDGAGTAHTVIDGRLCDGCAEVAVALNPSVAGAHAIIEALIPIGSPDTATGIGPYTMMVSGPTTTQARSDDPDAYFGLLASGGGASIGSVADLAWAVAAHPLRAAPGAVVEISGTGFGSTEGEVFVGLAGALDSDACDVIAWSDGRVVVRLPNSVADKSGVFVRLPGGQIAPIAALKVAADLVDAGDDLQYANSRLGEQDGTIPAGWGVTGEWRDVIPRAQENGFILAGYDSLVLSL